MELVEQAGPRAVAVPGDVTDEAYCEPLVGTAVAELGGLDVLADIAGKQQHCPDVLELTDEQVDATCETNVSAIFWPCRGAGSG
ncbi:SDR family NAD(P)-dependent oxidoreductase [Streptomyces sp.]|uniref:SDR family NAD(P)-dependent oxidoreductase n=1 Tax=Streptomyces sp. TaxID=1931 RepID=UPI0028118940|nr:SDR family NAD(P)-dependent oxidoreductase [Streptomyces sp.]